MSEENNGKDESITTHTPRKRNWISGIDNDNIAMGAAGIATAIALYSIFKDPITNMLQNFALARQQAPPPPPSAQATPITPQPELPLPPAVNEYVDEPTPNANAELAEVDHKNYQTTRRKPRNGQQSQSQFGLGIAGG